MTGIRPVVLACLSVSLLPGYTFRLASPGVPLHRTDAGAIQFLVNQSIAAGVTNADGAVMITADSDPAAAFQSAAAAWNNVSTAAVNFLPFQSTAAVNDPSDNQNVIVFDDTPDNRSIVGQALAVTVTAYYDDGRIADSDIVFNPTLKFSTTLAPNTYDLQSVATHEFGHSLGANHSGLLDATMFQGTALQSNSQSALTPDDLAMVSDAYPSPSATATYGVLSGAVTLTTGDPVLGALLVAVDPAAGVTIGGFSSLTDGTFSFKVPLGSYLVYAEPLNGPVFPANLYLTPDQTVTTPFQTGFYGGLSAPQLVDVTSGYGTANLQVSPGAAPFSIQEAGTGSVRGSGDYALQGGVTLLTAGKSVDLLLIGSGLDSPGAQYDVRLLGPGLTIRPGSIHFDANTNFGGSRALRMTVDVAPRPNPMTAGIVVASKGVAVAFSGSLLALPAQ